MSPIPCPIALILHTMNLASGTMIDSVHSSMGLVIQKNTKIPSEMRTGAGAVAPFAKAVCQSF